MPRNIFIHSMFYLFLETVRFKIYLFWLGGVGCAGIWMYTMHSNSKVICLIINSLKYIRVYYRALFISYCGVRVARSVFCVMFYRSLFVLLSFFFWLLRCLSLLRLTTSDPPPLVSSNFSSNSIEI
jgi:hypothetical protein